MRIRSQAEEGLNLESALKTTSEESLFKTLFAIPVNRGDFVKSGCQSEDRLEFWQSS